MRRYAKDMDGNDVRRAASEAVSFLSAMTDRSWDARAPSMDVTVRDVVAHIAEVLLWYAADLWSGPTELDTADITVRPSSTPKELVRTISTYAEVLASGIDTASDEVRGYHPVGSPDRSGFAAMGCDEILVHTWDVARGLDAQFIGSAGLCAAVVRRLFPAAPPHNDAWELLLWANGRLALAHYHQRETWRWHCAPLSEFNRRRRS